MFPKLSRMIQFGPAGSDLRRSKTLRQLDSVSVAARERGPCGLEAQERDEANGLAHMCNRESGQLRMCACSQETVVVRIQYKN